MVITNVYACRRAMITPAGQRHRIREGLGQLGAARVAQAAYLALIERDGDALCRLTPVPEHERAQRNFERTLALAEPSRLAFGRRFAIAEAPQFVLEVGLRDTQPLVHLERARINARRQRKAPPLELVAHADIQVQREAGGEQRAGEERIPEKLAERRTPRHRRHSTKRGAASALS